uniref:Predicted protein n=1 Tax=Physcomitrium patens TaxID=3218 RepID=A9U5I7_PHYPA
MGHTEMLHLIPITGVSWKEKDQFNDGYLEYWVQRPTPVQILSGQVQSPRYSQPGHTEMLRSILITGVSRKRKDQFTRQRPTGWDKKNFDEQSKRHPYRFMVYSCSRLYSNSQKLIDCLTIGESLYYLLQPNVRRVLEQESTNSKAMIERKLWQPKHCKQWSIKLIKLMEGIFQDVDRVTKKLFLEWIERHNKNLQATELLREFERQYSQLSKVEKLTLESNKVDLFLQAADGELQEKLELLLEDKEEDEGLTTKWKNIEDTVGLLTKRERRKDRSNIPKTVQAPKAPVCTTLPTMPTVQPLTSLSKKADMGMEEIIRGMRDLQIKLARLEENTSTNNSKNVSKQGYVQRCIWCDDASHTRKDCNEFNNMIRQ